MDITGIGVLQAQLLPQQTSQSSLQNILLNNAAPAESSYEKESIHMEIELQDGTTVTIDYARVGTQKKTAYELSQYGNYTYGTDYFSPENTADRILDFAKALWDGSSEKLETLADAIEEGIAQARKVLGNIPGWLDNIISQTVDLLHEGLDDMRADVEEAA